MAESWTIDTDEAVTFDAFLDHFRRLGDGIFRSDPEPSAQMMRRLANDRRFLVERLDRHLTTLAAFQSDNFYTPQVFLLHADEHFTVRVNLWLPPAGRPGEEMFLYEDAHDHNFDFFTVGYHGPGYRTRIYEYDRDGVVGYVGEPVTPRFLEDTTLPFGKVMRFRKGRDVHAQLPPASLSVSLNVLGRVPEIPDDQYLFDLPNGRLGPKVNTSAGLVPIRVAGILGDARTEHLLAGLTDHPARRLRIAARDALGVRVGPAAAWAGAGDDADPLVRRTAAERLAGGP